jgi:hypothetical protein
MPEPKPTLNPTEWCLYFHERNADRRAGMSALVLGSNGEGVLQLEVHVMGKIFYRKSVYHMHDPRLLDHPQQGRYAGGDYGGVWDYAEPAPRPGRSNYPEISVLEPQATSTEMKVTAYKTPAEIAAKLAELRDVNMKPADVAEEMRKFTGNSEWNSQLVAQRWRRMRENAETPVAV